MSEWHPNLPTEPPPGLLMSIALRLDHGLGCPGYYDQLLLAQPGITHARRLEVALQDARRAYEEIAGFGFYAGQREDKYAALASAALAEPNQP